MIKFFLLSFFMIILLFLLRIPSKVRLFFRKLLKVLPDKSSERSGDILKEKPTQILDEMKACELCATYVPSQMAFYFQNRIYCSQQCLVKAKSKG